MSKRNKKSKILIASLLLLIVVGTFAFVAVLYYFSFLGAFSILDVFYETPKHLAVFVGIYLILSIIGEFFVKGIYYVRKRKRRADTFSEYMLLFCMNFIMNWLIISMIDGLYQPVHVEWYTEIVLGAFISLAEVLLDNGSKKEKDDRSN
ncbi:YrvL family regulatory protein [Terribacillus sp. DMT04]|uniref:YrvL family regulatory protein n=1 Tax=Terribacillus sp. DMT04 TaxID=2850441 RepID=UPI001C2C2CFA|nr:YrvL family regulatory protein [Terribacillus sp. DMT04]QXE01599.1 regulatory YrvL family protein [Terribacillus sp. DMT04]